MHLKCHFQIVLESSRIKVFELPCYLRQEVMQSSWFVCAYVCVYVCLSVNTITQKIINILTPNFAHTFAIA